MNLKAHWEIRVSIPTIFSAIGAFHDTFKRVIFRPLLGETEEMWINRRTFAGWLLRQHHENKTMFFLDETGFNVSMRSCHGRAQRGANAETSIPNIRSRNISVMAVHYEVLQGNGNTERFCHFIDDLAHHRDVGGYSNETILIMDNVAFHRSPAVRELLELRGFPYFFYHLTAHFALSKNNYHFGDIIITSKFAIYHFN